MKLATRAALTLLLLFNTACKSHEKPDAPLSFEQMAQAHKEFLIIESGLSTTSGDKAKKDSLLTLHFARSLKNQKIGLQEYNESYAVYLSDPALMDSLYKRVIVLLMEEETRAKTKK